MIQHQYLFAGWSCRLAASGLAARRTLPRPWADRRPFRFSGMPYQAGLAVNLSHRICQNIRYFFPISVWWRHRKATCTWFPIFYCTIIRIINRLIRVSNMKNTTLSTDSQHRITFFASLAKWQPFARRMLSTISNSLPSISKISTPPFSCFKLLYYTVSPTVYRIAFTKYSIYLSFIISSFKASRFFSSARKYPILTKRQDSAQQ